MSELSFGTGIVERPSEKIVPPNLDRDGTTLLHRLRAGSQWLADNHQLWSEDDPTAADDEAFSKAWAGWWELDRKLRADHGFQGCIHGPDRACPEGFPCPGCAEATVPSVVAQLELASAGE